MCGNEILDSYLDWQHQKQGASVKESCVVPNSLQEPFSQTYDTSLPETNHLKAQGASEGWPLNRAIERVGATVCACSQRGADAFLVQPVHEKAAIL
jgi:hypothetical protein